jgi:hypothetical protein
MNSLLDSGNRYNRRIMIPNQADPNKLEERRAALMAIVGLWKDRTDIPDTEIYIRNLRNGSRLERLQALWRSDDE